MLQDICMDPADLPEYLRPLMKWEADELTLCKREELAAAIYDFRDVFSSGRTNTGRTGLAEHTIDTGDHWPIRMTLTRLLVANQEIEQEEVQKMLDQGGDRAISEQLGEFSGSCD